MEEVLKKVIECFEANIKITEALVSDLKKVLSNGLPVPPATKRGKKATAEEPKTEPPATTTAPKKAEEPELGGHPHDDNAADLAAKGEPKPHAEGGALQVKDVTIEMIRERSTVYSDSKNFGMDAWLALAQKVTGQKKVKDIPKEMYGAFYAAMDVEIEKLKRDRDTISKPSLPAAPAVEKPAEPSKSAAVEKPAVAGVTLDQLRAKGKEFMDRNGQDALIALVKAFGATKLSEIAKEKYPAFLEAISNA